MTQELGWIGVGRTGEATVRRLGLGPAKALGVSMPAAAAKREALAGMVGRGPQDVDFAVPLVETARDAGLELKPENVPVDDGLQS
jgi:3-hydroxyisobutyrate dehydrogenase